MAQENNNNLAIVESLVNESNCLQETDPNKSLQMAVMALSIIMVEYEEEKKRMEEQQGAGGTNAAETASPYNSVYGKESASAKQHLEKCEHNNDAYKLKAVYDPEKEAERQIKLMKLCVEDGLDFIKDGFVKFADWAKAMVTDFGEKIKKYLKQTYMSMTAYVDDRTFEQMDSAQTVRGFDLDSIVIDEEEEAEENNNNNNDDNGREEVLRGSRVPNGTDTNRPSRDADNGGRGVQHGADHGGNGEVEMAGGGARSASQKLDNANGSDGNGRKGTDRDRPSDTGGRNADIESAGNGDEVGRGRDILNGTESPETTDKTDRKEKERTKADLGDKTVPYAPHNKCKGFVLGDMGGIGKGRQGAATIRWAINIWQVVQRYQCKKYLSYFLTNVMITKLVVFPNRKLIIATCIINLKTRKN